MDIQVIISVMAILFILIILGYICSKLKVLPPETGKVLTKLVLNVTLPCTVLSSVVSGELSISGGETAFFLLMTLLVLLIHVIIALPTARVLCSDKASRGLYGAFLIFGNVGFMGFPVIGAIFGAEAVFYVALFNIPFQVLSFSLGIMLISGKGGRHDPRVLLSPTLICSLLAIPLGIIGFKAPDVIAEAIRLSGNMTTPTTMFIIGVTLAQVPVKNVFTEWRLYPSAVLKLTVVPVVVWLILRVFITDAQILGILVVLSAMPTAVIVAMFAIEYGNDEHTASKSIFLTTLMSCATIPLMVYLLLV